MRSSLGNGWTQGQSRCRQKKGCTRRRNRAAKSGGVLQPLYCLLKGVRGRGTLAKEQPPLFGISQRGGEVLLRRLANVQQNIIKPLLKTTIVSGSQVDLDEYTIYKPLID